MLELGVFSVSEIEKSSILEYNEMGDTMKKMIVVDDEIIVRRGIRETIDWQSMGIEIVAEAENGLSAIDYIEHHPVDVVLTDIKMPLMDGVELVKRIRLFSQTIAIIVLSGYKDFEFAKGALENGAFEYLLKPIDNQQLVSSVLRGLEKSEEVAQEKRKASVFDLEGTSIRNRFLEDLFFTDIFTIDQISEKSKLLNIPLPSCGKAVQISIDMASYFTSEIEVEQLMDYLETSLFKLFDEGRITVYQDSSMLAFLLKDAEEADSTLLHEYLKKYDEVHHDPISIAISSSFSELQEIHLRFEETKVLLEQKLFLSLSSISEGNKPDRKIKPIVKETMDYISKHYGENITVKSVSDALFVSESYLLHLFKDTTNRTFNDCLTTYRVMMAKKLLFDDKYKIYEIADMVGYSDVKYFSQVFRKKTHMTPSQYRSLKEANHHA